MKITDQLITLNEIDFLYSEFDDFLEFDLSRIKDTAKELPEKIINSLKKIDPQKAIKEYQKRQTYIKSEIIKHVPDFNSTIKKVEKIGKQIANKIKKNNKSNKNMAISAKDVKNSISSQIRLAIDELTTTEKIDTTVIYIMFIYLINTICHMILIIVTGNTAIALLITAIFIAPLVEEKAKNSALEKNIKFGFQYTFSFAIFEFFLYVVPIMMLTNVAIVPILILRAIAVIFHMSTAYVQSKFVKQGYGEAGYFIGVLMHAAYNSIAILIL